MKGLYLKLKELDGMPSLHLVGETISFDGYYLGIVNGNAVLFKDNIIFIINSKGIKNGNSFPNFRATIKDEEAKRLYNVALTTQEYIRTNYEDKSES